MSTKRVLMLAAAWSLAFAAGAQTKHVLVVSDSARGRAAAIITDSFEAGLEHRYGRVDMFVEALDVNRFPQPEHGDVFARYLREKYSRTSIEAVVAMGPSALAFFAARGEALFPGVPVVFAGVRPSSVPSDDSLPNATGIVSRFELAETLELAMRLQPDARAIAVVTGTAPLDRGWHELARSRLASYEDRFAVTHLAGLPRAVLLERLAALPRDTIVLYLSMRSDGNNEYQMAAADAARTVIAASAAPVYGPYETYVGDGAVGGYVESYAAMGDAIAAATARILEGEPASNIPVVRSAEVFLVDWRQLRRWGLDEARLPAGTTVLYRDPSIWVQYRMEILGTIALVALQSALIAALLLYIRKRRVERRLHETEDRYRNVVEAQTDLVCRYRPDATLTFVNDAYCNYFGRAREQLVGTKFTELLPEAERAKGLEHVRALSQQPKTIRRVDERLAPDGSSTWLRWIDHPIVDSSGRVIELQSIGHDITDLKRAEHEAQQRREQVTHLTRVSVLGELSGAIAHELHQPITAVLNNAQAAEQLLAQEPLDVSELKEIVADIIADETRAGDVISRLRSMLKPGSSAFVMLDAKTILAEVAALLRTQLAERGVTAFDRCAPDLPPIFGDRVQLQQVLLNLMMNACDAMSGNEPGDRVLLITAECDGATVRIAVTDNGTGLAPHLMDRLFQPFVTTKSHGLGLGLSICRTIIRAHGGRLSARNNAERGATVAFTLPVAQVRDSADPPGLAAG